ncbi:Kelch-like protein 12 [Nymphaea thermarum]|nr:Kelch-like protein 12 [Nymphaea thermarum]
MRAYRRFSHAAVELGGAVYVVGGYDGKEYLRSTERYDPREVSWTRLDSMSSRRGCPSLVVLNEKLYALGGYDGRSFLSSVEMFDPRIGSWIFADPMNSCRGYAAAVTLGDSVHIVGGLSVIEKELVGKLLVQRPWEEDAFTQLLFCRLLRIKLKELPEHAAGLVRLS